VCGVFAAAAGQVGVGFGLDCGHDGEIKAARQRRASLCYAKSFAVPRVGLRAAIGVFANAINGLFGTVAPMTERDREFRVRPGRIRSARLGSPKTFLSRVLRAAKTAGHYSPTSRGIAPGRSGFGRGRIAFSRSRLFSPARRVVIKARVVRHQGRAFRSAPLSAHVGYLKREGVTRDGARAEMFDARSDRADDAAFSRRCADDRHHFRFIVSPEDAADLTDLRAFTRDLVRQMEADLDTRLDWIAVDHWNTDNPHVHLLVRGVDERGADLVVSRDYISRGLRSRAEDLVAIELGPRPDHAIQTALEREVTAERWTRLDGEIRFLSNEAGYVDLRPDRGMAEGTDTRRLMIGRLQHLERMGLATAAGPAEWMIAPEAERRLRDLGLRGDIIKTMHQAFTRRGQDRSPVNYAIDGAAPAAPIIGRLVDTGLHDELSGEAYAVIDGVDGRAHHVRFRGIEAFAHAPPRGGIVEVRRLGGPETARTTLVLAGRSDLELAAQVRAPGATWLDYRLVERTRMPLSAAGFGGEVKDALAARANYLADHGLARRDGGRIVPQRNLLDTLRTAELDQTGARLSAETGRPYVKAASGDAIAGIYRERVTLTSGRFAMIDNGLGFQLVPWSPQIDARIGQALTGVAGDNGAVTWSLGRKRGLAL